MAAGGTLVYKKLADGETVTVDSRSVVAIEESVHLDIVSNGRFCTCCCGGEGCFSTTLTGPGKVYMQVGYRKDRTEWPQATVLINILFAEHEFQEVPRRMTKSKEIF